MKKLFLSFFLTSLAILAGGQSAASGEDAKFSCMSRDGGKVVNCIISSGYGNSASLEGAKALGCSHPGQTVGTTCPTKDLLGCCTTKAYGRVVENCVYKDGILTNTPADCAKSSGTWSAKP